MSALTVVGNSRWGVVVYELWSRLGYDLQPYGLVDGVRQGSEHRCAGRVCNECVGL